MKKKKKKNKYENIKQKSFYFKDYLETNKSNKKNRDSIILQDRVYLLFFLFFSLITIFSIKIIIISLKDFNAFTQKSNSYHNQLLRRDIIDRNGIIL